MDGTGVISRIRRENSSARRRSRVLYHGALHCLVGLHVRHDKRYECMSVLCDR